MMSTQSLFLSTLLSIVLVCWFAYYSYSYYYYYYSFRSSFRFDFDFDFSFDLYIFDEYDDAIIVIIMIYSLSSGFLAGLTPALSVQCARPVSIRFSHSFHLGIHFILHFFCFSFVITNALSAKYYLWLLAVSSINNIFHFGTMPSGASSVSCK